MLEMEQNEISVFKSRGASKSQIIRIYLIQGLLIAAAGTVGGIPIGVLICKYFSKRQALEHGVFEKNVPIADGYAEHPIRGREAAKLFFCPSMVIFFVLTVGEIGLLVLLSFVM